MEFQDLKFKEENDLVVTLYELFEFVIPKEELNKIGKYELTDHSFKGNEKKFGFLISKYITNLKHKQTKKNALYIHSHSEIPLIGSNYFGLVDRNTNLIEIKPLTSCNLSCTFCSVDEGPTSKKRIDFILEKDYIVQEFKKLIKQKKCNQIEVCINPQGEPFLYSRIVELIQDIAKVPEVKIISVNSNGTLLTRNKIDKLVKAGLTRVNFSLNAMGSKAAQELADSKAYNLNKTLEIIKYASKKLNLNIAPVWLKGVNDTQIVPLIKFVKELEKETDKTIFLGIQTLLHYRFGRNPVKEMPFEEFSTKLKELEKEYDINLTSSPNFNFINTEKLPKPFKKNQVIKVKIFCEGRVKNEMLGVCENRVISIINCFENVGKTVKAKIIKTKHNIITACLAT